MAKEKKIAVLPGSYDPVTKGHMDIIVRAAKLFDEVRVLLCVNSSKSYCFTEEQRLEMLRAACKALDNVTVEKYDGLLADYVTEQGVCAIVKGVRNTTDFEYESWMAAVNGTLSETETVFLPADPTLSFINSTMVRELLRYGKDVSAYVPEAVAEMAKQSEKA